MADAKTITITKVGPVPNSDKIMLVSFIREGDDMEIQAKCWKDQIEAQGIVLGAKITVELEKKEGKGDYPAETWFKNKGGAKKGGGSYGSRSQEERNEIIAQSSLSAAIAFHNGEGDGIAIMKTAKTFYNFVKLISAGKPAVAPTTPAPATDGKEDDEYDPFAED